jgi:uncharacterized protein YlxW (UPF0749 family)
MELTKRDKKLRSKLFRQLRNINSETKSLADYITFLHNKLDSLHAKYLAKDKQLTNFFLKWDRKESVDKLLKKHKIKVIHGR